MSAIPNSEQLGELGDPIPGTLWRICVGCAEAFCAAEPRTKYCCPECRAFYADQRRAARAEGRA